MCVCVRAHMYLKRCDCVKARDDLSLLLFIFLLFLRHGLFWTWSLNWLDGLGRQAPELLVHLPQEGLQACAVTPGFSVGSGPQAHPASLHSLGCLLSLGYQQWEYNIISDLILVFGTFFQDFNFSTCCDFHLSLQNNRGTDFSKRENMREQLSATLEE